MNCNFDIEKLKFDEKGLIPAIVVDNIAKEANDAKLITVVNSLAEIYGSKACVEGVESEEQFEIVKNCGVSSVQGYYFSKPLPLDVFCERLELFGN